MRAAIHRHLTSSPHNKNVDILNGISFKAANNMLRTMIGRWMGTKKTAGENCYHALEKNDLVKLRNYFDRSTPEKLQQEVFFDIIYHFGFRGREWLRDLKKEDILIKKDDKGCDFIDLRRSSLSKNVKPSLKSKEYEDRKSPLMYSTPESPQHCPVTAIQSYLAKLDEENQDLFPRPLKNINIAAPGPCFAKKGVLGKNTLCDLMKIISEKAQLSRVYTNHCIRSTVVTELINKNVPIEEIQVVTGHKNRSSVERYTKRVSNAKKKRLSDSLALALINASGKTIFY